MLRKRRLIRSWGNCCHSSQIAVLNSSIFWHFGLRWLIIRPIQSHTCSIGLMSGDIAGHGIVWTACCCKNMLYNSGFLWPSVVVHEHWPVSQRMIVEMGDYAWSEHIVTVFLACQITNKNIQSPTYSQRKNNARQLHPHPQKQLCPKCGCPEMKCFVGAKPLHNCR